MALHYPITQVRALSALGHELLVIAGRPDNAPDAEQAPTEGARQLLQVHNCPSIHHLEYATHLNHIISTSCRYHCLYGTV